MAGKIAARWYVVIGVCPLVFKNRRRDSWGESYRSTGDYSGKRFRPLVCYDERKIALFVEA